MSLRFATEEGDLGNHLDMFFVLIVGIYMIRGRIFGNVLFFQGHSLFAPYPHNGQLHKTPNSHLNLLQKTLENPFQSYPRESYDSSNL